MCWVKRGEDGKPVSPFECAGVVDGCAKAKQEPTSAQPSAAQLSPTLALGAQPAAAAAAVVQSGVAEASSEVGALAQAGAEAAGEPATPTAMLSQVHAWVKELCPDKKKWLSDLPAVQVRADYCGRPAPIYV